MTVRLTKDNDVKHIFDFVIKLGYEVEFNEVKSKFLNFLNFPGNEVAVVEKEGKVVGAIAWTASYMFVNPCKRLRVEGIFVSEEYRLQKLGRKLFEYAENYAVMNNYDLLETAVDKKRINGKLLDFYKSLGYVDDQSLAKEYLYKEIKHS